MVFQLARGVANVRNQLDPSASSRWNVIIANNNDQTAEASIANGLKPGPVIARITSGKLAHLKTS